MAKTWSGLRTWSVGVLLASFCIGTLAVPRPVAAAPTITITVVNSGARAIDGLYLSLYADRGWGPDQLNGVALAPGASVVLSNVACTTSSIVVIGEDEGGCFLYRSVACSGDAAWTITSNAARDCGR